MSCPAAAPVHWWNNRPLKFVPPQNYYPPSPAEEKFLWFKNYYFPGIQGLDLPDFVRENARKRISDVYDKKGGIIALGELKSYKVRYLEHISAHHSKYKSPLTGALKNNSAGSAFRYKKSAADNYTAKPDFVSLDLLNLVYKFNALYKLTPEDIQQLAQKIALFIYGEFCDTLRNTPPGLMFAAAQQAAVFAGYFMQAVKINRCAGNEAIASLLARLCCEHWWRRRLRKYADRWREHLAILCGETGRLAKPGSTAPYCSRRWAAIWRSRQRDNRQALKNLQIENENGDRLDLLDQIDASVSDPAIRRCELMTRTRGYDEYAQQTGCSGWFFTITAPSAYHARNRHGRRNKKYNGSTPAQTQRYLCGVWARIRACFKRENIRVFGLRTAEAHHDGTPHWHGVLFVKPEQAQRMAEIMRLYACAQDAEELNTREGTKPRFDIRFLDPSRGSATAYVTKYISKNIDGHGMQRLRDDETGTAVSISAVHASAWASLWGIRQFQFTGCVPVVVWRELRRLKRRTADFIISLPEVVRRLFEAADGGNWHSYVTLQGGALSTRRDLTLRAWYQPGAEGEYGNQVRQVRGVVLQTENQPPVITRVHQWKIVKKSRAAGSGGEGLRGSGGASAPSRTRDNNCTQYEKHTVTGHISVSQGYVADFFALPAPPPELSCDRPPDNSGEKIRNHSPPALALSLTEQQNIAALRQQAARAGYELADFQLLHLLRGGLVNIAGNTLTATDGGKIRTDPQLSVQEIDAIAAAVQEITGRVRKSAGTGHDR